MTPSNKISELREALNVPYQDRKFLLGSAIEDAAKAHLTLLEAIEMQGTWKIVPVEPTNEMLQGCLSRYDQRTPEDATDRWMGLQSDWCCMILGAPKYKWNADE